MEDNKKLIIPIYLNQKIVFDMLAILEDGFSNIRSVSKTTSSEGGVEGNIGGEIGFSNIFALLPIKLSGSIKGEKKGSRDETVNEERTHTPTSLFAKLLEILEYKKYIKKLNSFNDLKNIGTGDFVELKGILEKNPLISTLESFSRMMELAVIFESGKSSQQGKGGGNKYQAKTVVNQIEGMTNSLKTGGMIDVLCVVNNNDEEFCAVLQTYIDFYNNRNMNEIIDGEYTILGKVVKIVNDTNDSINLLRNTSLSMAKENLMNQMIEKLNSPNIEESGLEIPDIRTRIKEKGILIIPIAIYT